MCVCVCVCKNMQIYKTMAIYKNWNLKTCSYFK